MKRCVNEKRVLTYLFGEVEKFLFKYIPGIFQQKQFVSQLDFLGDDGGERLELDNLLLRSHGRINVAGGAPRSD